MGVTGFVSVRFVSAFYYSVSSPSPPFHWLRIPGQLPNDCGGKDFASSCNNGKRRSLSLSVCLSVSLSLSLYIYICNAGFIICCRFVVVGGGGGGGGGDMVLSTERVASTFLRFLRSLGNTVGPT